MSTIRRLMLPNIILATITIVPMQDDWRTDKVFIDKEQRIKDWKQREKSKHGKKKKK